MRSFDQHIDAISTFDQHIDAITTFDRYIDAISTTVELDVVRKSKSALTNKCIFCKNITED